MTGTQEDQVARIGPDAFTAASIVSDAQADTLPTFWGHKEEVARIAAALRTLQHYSPRPFSDGGGMGPNPDGIWIAPTADDLYAAGLRLPDSRVDASAQREAGGERSGPNIAEPGLDAAWAAQIAAAEREVVMWGDALVTLLGATPAECNRDGDICVPHEAEWSTRNGTDSGHCEWIEARQEAVPAYHAAVHDFGTLAARLRENHP